MSSGCVRFGISKDCTKFLQTSCGEVLQTRARVREPVAAWRLALRGGFFRLRWRRTAASISRFSYVRAAASTVRIDFRRAAKQLRFSFS
jgi:hypothetical protein